MRGVKDKLAGLTALAGELGISLDAFCYVGDSDRDAPALSPYSPQHRDALLGAPFDRVALAAKGLAYERLDQLTVDLLLGFR